jgi:hypothetical protein
MSDTRCERFHSPSGQIRTKHENDRRGSYSEGIVLTHFGIVRVYSQESWPTTTDLCMILKGKIYTRYFKKHYSERYLVTLADRFASEMHRGL